MNTGFFHGSTRELSVGTILQGGRRSGPVEDLLEAYGPSSLDYTEAVFLVERPEDVEGAMPAVGAQHVYEVEPLGRVLGPFDSGWFQEIAAEASRRGLLRRDLAKRSMFARMAAAYWRGEPSPTPGVHEYLTSEARVARAAASMLGGAREAQEAPAKLRVQNSVLDAHRGEVFGETIARLDGKVVGRISWGSYQGETHLKMIEVDPQYRRQGIAEAMYKSMREDNGEPVNWGAMTPEGKALYRHLKQHRALESSNEAARPHDPPSLPFALVRAGDDVIPVLLGEGGSDDPDTLVGLDIVHGGQPLAFAPGDILALVNAEPAAVFYGVHAELASAQMPLAAEEEAAKKGETLVKFPGLEVRKGLPFKVRARGQRFQWTDEKPRGLSAFPEVEPVLMKQRAGVPTLETIRMATIFAGLTVHAGTDEAEDTFSRVVAKFKAMHKAMPPLEMIQEIIGSHLPQARLAMYESALPWSTVVQDAMKRGLRDRELRRHLWTEIPVEDMLENIGLAKMSFALMLMGQNVACLDTWILGGAFAEDPFGQDDLNQAAVRRRETACRISKQWGWAPAKKGREMGLKRYEQVEDALVKKNPFFDPDSPIAYAQCQWTSWEWALGVPASHRPWLEITKELHAQPVDLQAEAPF